LYASASRRFLTRELGQFILPVNQREISDIGINPSVFADELFFPLLSRFYKLQYETKLLGKKSTYEFWHYCD
jgi:hypothetical protein